jgi:FtsP/CotA-like multicopper oxidase with cupredoxin domain
MASLSRLRLPLSMEWPRVPRTALAAASSSRCNTLSCLPPAARNSSPPAITTINGFVEWTIEHRAEEAHGFHMHQIHFQLLQRNGETLPSDQQQFLDTVQVPSWSGTGPYSSITVKMDFRGEITGDFVYHCHIFRHEDGGMTAIVRVLPRT